MEEQLKIDFEKNLKNLSYSDQEKNFKENNFKEFLKQGFPNRKLENWKFSDLNQIIKSNIGDLTVLDPSINKKLLSQLKPEYVFVGLNFSSIDELVPFANFHSPSPKAQDFKIRFALRNTDYWGSYMTDIIKNFEEKKSNKMMDVLNEDKNLENRNIEIFLEEIESLGVPNKKIIAFGGDTYKILERNLKDKYNLVKVTHYSHFISKENYRYELAKI